MSKEAKVFGWALAALWLLFIGTWQAVLWTDARTHLDPDITDAWNVTLGVTFFTMMIASVFWAFIALEED